MTNGYDRVFEFAPQFGKYQMLIFIVGYIASATIYGPMLTAGVYFQYEAPHRCRTEFDSETSNYSEIYSNEVLRQITPRRDDDFDGCSLFVYEVFDQDDCDAYRNSSDTSTEHLSKTLVSFGATNDCVIVSEATRECQSFVFDRSKIDNTIATENNLVCERKWISKVITLATMVGMIVGPTLSGMVSDRIGRIMTIVLFCFITLGFSVITGSFGTYHWSIYGLFRILSVMGSSGIGITFFVFIMESVGDRFRPRLGLLYITTTIGVGMVMLSFVVKAFQNWQYAQFTLSACCVAIAFFTRMLNESPRWLYANEKDEQARQYIRKMGRWDGIQITDRQFADFEKQMDEDKSKVDDTTQATLRDLIGRPLVRRTTVIIMANQFVRGIINYGFLFNIDSLSGDIFINNIINNLTGIPAFLMLCITVDNRYLGRIGNFIVTLYLAGISCFVLFFGKLFGLTLVVRVASYVGMFASTAATSVGYVYTAEVYPTQVRNVGVGCSSSSAMFGALVSPLMAIIGGYVWWFPPIFNGIIAIAAGTMSFWLPETNNQPMTATLEDFERQYGPKTESTVEKTIDDVFDNESSPSSGDCNPGFELEETVRNGNC